MNQDELETYNEELIEAQERQAEMNEYQNQLDEEWFEWVNSQTCTD